MTGRNMSLLPSKYFDIETISSNINEEIETFPQNNYDPKETELETSRNGTKQINIKEYIQQISE